MIWKILQWVCGDHLTQFHELLFWKNSNALFVKIRPIVDLGNFLMHHSFLIKSFKLNRLKSRCSFSWSLFEIQNFSWKRKFRRIHSLCIKSLTTQLLIWLFIVSSILPLGKAQPLSVPVELISPFLLLANNYAKDAISCFPVSFTKNFRLPFSQNAFR